VVEDISNRFRNGDLVAAFQIFDPKLVPAGEDELEKYGTEKLDAILEHYGKEATATLTSLNDVRSRRDAPVVKAELCRGEWIPFRRMMQRGMQSKDFEDLASFLRWFYSGSMPEYFPNLSVLLQIVAVLPVGSVSVERSFSVMKLIKTRLRNSISDDNMEWLMLIASEGPEKLTDEQADAILNRFRDLKPRRIAL